MLFRLVFLVALTITFHQVCDAKAVAEDINGLQQGAGAELYVRDVEGKAERISDNEVRKAMIRDKGFFPTVFADLKYIFWAPLEWLWSLIILPWNFLKNIKYTFDIRKENGN